MCFVTHHDTSSVVMIVLEETDEIILLHELLVQELMSNKLNKKFLCEVLGRVMWDYYGIE